MKQERSQATENNERIYPNHCITVKLKALWSVSHPFANVSLTSLIIETTCAASAFAVSVRITEAWLQDPII